MKTIFLILVLINPFYSQNIKGKNCCLKNKKQAIEFAKKEFIKAFGISILEMKPFQAILINNEIWQVKGTRPKHIIGGVPYVEVQKKDCLILKLYHTK